MHSFLMDAVPVLGNPGELLCLGYLVWRVTRIERIMTAVRAEELSQASRIRKIEAALGIAHPK